MIGKQLTRPRSECGFTLIELLVVILIIGILAAIAIPSFLNQKSKASDAAAKELAHTAQVAAEAYGLDHLGYLGLTPAGLVAYEATIQTSAGAGNAYLSSIPFASATGYEVIVTAASGDTFSITRNAAGTITRSCTGSAAGCINGSW